MPGGMAGMAACMGGAPGKGPGPGMGMPPGGGIKPGPGPIPAGGPAAGWEEGPASNCAAASLRHGEAEQWCDNRGTSRRPRRYLLRSRDASEWRHAFRRLGRGLGQPVRRDVAPKKLSREAVGV